MQAENERNQIGCGLDVRKTGATRPALLGSHSLPQTEQARVVTINAVLIKDQQSPCVYFNYPTTAVLRHSASSTKQLCSFRRLSIRDNFPVLVAKRICEDEGYSRGF